MSNTRKNWTLQLTSLRLTLPDQIRDSPVGSMFHVKHQIGLLMKEKNIAPEDFVLTKFHSLDVVNTDSVDVINLCVAKNSTKIFQKDNDEFFALLTAPNIKRTLIMAAQHFSNVELSKIEIERRNSDTKIHRFTCYFDLRDSKVEPQ